MWWKDGSQCDEVQTVKTVWEVMVFFVFRVLKSSNKTSKIYQKDLSWPTQELSAYLKTKTKQNSRLGNESQGLKL